MKMHLKNTSAAGGSVLETSIDARQPIIPIPTGNLEAPVTMQWGSGKRSVPGRQPEVTQGGLVRENQRIQSALGPESAKLAR